MSEQEIDDLLYQLRSIRIDNERLRQLVEQQEKLLAAYRVGNVNSADRCIDKIRDLKEKLGLK